MKIKIIHILNHVNTDSLLISFWNTVIEKIQAWKRQTRAWVTCAKPSRQNKNPGVSYTFIRSLLRQHYPKYISDVVSKILKKKNTIIRSFVWIWDLGLQIFIIAYFSRVNKVIRWLSYGFLSVKSKQTNKQNKLKK